MRVHRLTLTAFGPYPGTETVDFDALNDAGVFLMTGPTGAGKTSLLDAVCFALYGVVPGERAVRSLRSHHAPPDAQPEVVLEVTLGDRRLRIHRTPEWSRPKRRGTGTTRQQASARLLDLTDGQERLVSSRIQEVGHELGLALGMTSEQFMQVVLLPQGEFQTFLRATSDERQKVLEKLFATERFARIEQWMAERASQLRARSGTGERHIAHLLGALANRAGTTPPEGLADLGRRDVALVTTEATAWAGDLRERARDVARLAAEHDRAVAAEVGDLEARWGRAQSQGRTLQQARQARATLVELAAREPERAAARAALESHRRAEVATGAGDRLDALRAEVARARDEVAALLRRHRRADSSVEPAGEQGADPAAGLTRHRALRDRVTTRLAELAGAEPLARRLDHLRARGDELAARGGAIEAQLAALDERARDLPGRRDALEERVAELGRLAATHDHARAEAAAALRRHEATTRLPDARAESAALERAALDARAGALAAKEHHLDVVERRLAGMAAELASQLGDGDPCPVCGSAEHPAPSTGSGAPVTEAEQRARLREAQQAESAADAARDRAETAVTAVRLLEQQADGRDVAAAQDELLRADEALASARRAAADLPDTTARLAQVVEELTALATARQEATQAVAALQHDARAGAEELERTTRALEAVLDGASTYAEAVAAEQDRLAALDGLIAAHESLLGLEERLRTATAQAEDLATSQGFASLADARAALLPPAEREGLGIAVAELDRREAAAEQILADPHLAEVESALGDEEPEDPHALEVSLRDAQQRSRTAARAATTAADGAAALAALADQLDAALEAWAPEQRRHQTADRLSRLVRGTGSDNQLQMRLSSYVLATRLDQVLDAANERLALMRDHRYELRRTGERSGARRAGLGIEVLDAWTGEARGAATLSGGETFVVSLALALGLADVVSHESGGTRVDTLFVDEGFSALDPDTLDDVLDRLDALRAGGRTVGVVSHVTELRARIPTQLLIESTRSGSRVRTGSAVA